MPVVMKRLRNTFSPLLVISLLAMAAMPLSSGLQDTGAAHKRVWYSPANPGALPSSLLDRRPNPNSLDPTLKQALVPGQVSYDLARDSSFRRTEDIACLPHRAYDAAVLVRAPPCLH